MQRRIHEPGVERMLSPEGRFGGFVFKFRDFTPILDCLHFSKRVRVFSGLKPLGILAFIKGRLIIGHVPTENDAVVFTIGPECGEEIAVS